MSVTALVGVNATALAAGGLSNKLLAGLLDARVKADFDTYITVGTIEDGTSTIAMGRVLPKGANIVDVILYLSKALTSSVTLSVGDSNAATRYLNAVATTAAIAVHANLVGEGYIIGTNSGDNQILVTFNSANNAVTAAVIGVCVLYTHD